MQIGTLEIQLLADMAQLKRDMQDAKASVGDAMAEVTRAVDFAKQAFIGLTGIASIGAFTGMIKGSLDAAEALHDLSIQTGASVERLSAMEAVGRTTDTSVQTIANTMNKLSKNMAVATEESKGSAAALKALGIDFETFRAMKPDDQMLTLAQAMNKFEDGGGKSAAAMALMGKEGAKLLPYMKDLANSGELIATTTTEQAAAADAYNDALTESGKRVENFKRELAFGLLPSMVDVFDLTQQLGQTFGSYLAGETHKTTDEITGMKLVVSGLGTVMETILVVGSDVAFVLKGMGREIGGIAAQTVALMSLDFAGFSQIRKDMQDDAVKSREELDKFQNSVVGMTQRVQQASEAVRGSTVSATDNQREMRNLMERTNQVTQGQLNFTAQTDDAKRAAREHAAELKKQEAAYASLTGGIDAKILSAQTELTTTGKVTDASKVLDKVYADMWAGTLLLTNAELDAVEARLKTLDTMQKHIELQKEEKKLQDDMLKDADGVLQELYKRTDALRDDNKRLQEHNEAIGLDERALLSLTQTRLLDKAALLEGSAATKDDTGNLLANSGELTEQARLLRERAALLGDGIIAKEANEAKKAWEATTAAIGTGLSSALTNAVLGGRDIWLTFRDYMVSLIIDGAIKNAFASVITNGLNSMISSLTGVRLGSAAGGAGESSLLGSALNAGADKLTGGTGGVTGALSSAASTIGSALGLTGGSAAAGASMLGSTAGSAAAINGGIASGTAAFEAALAGSGAAAGGTAAAGGAAAGSSAAGTSAMGGFGAVAGPVAAMLAVFTVMNSMNDKDGLNVWNTYDASGKGGSGPLDGPIAQRNRFAMNRPTMDAMADSYVSTARALKMTPEAGAFGFDWASDGTFNMGATFDGGRYRSGWVPNSADMMEWARARALFTALQASEKPKSIAGFFDGVDAGLLPLADIQERLAQAAAAPKFALGGDHMGGLRIVGERGPELEATGPARIFNSQQTANILNGGNNSEQVAVLKATVANQQAQIAQNAAAYRMMVDKLDQIARSVSDTAKSQRMQMAAA